jgi:hypothetical protein
MLLSLVYFVLRRLLHALAPSDRSELECEAELLVLRHQLKVLSRGVHRPLFRRRDRMLIAATSRILPRERWKAFIVSPGTVLRWQGAGPPQVDVSEPKNRHAATRSDDGGAHRSPREREPQMGLPEDPGRAAETWRQGVRHLDPVGPSPRRPRACPSPERALVGGVPPSPSPRDLGLRLLHRGDGVVSNHVRAVRHRALIQTGPPPRCHQEPGFGVGHPAGPEPGDRGAPSRHTVPDPRPGLEVLRSIRRGVPDRGCEDRQDSHPGTEGQRIRRAVGEDGAPGVPRPPVDPRPTSP